MNKKCLLVISVVSSLNLVSACKPRTYNDNATTNATNTSFSLQPTVKRLTDKNMCAAVRGNGQLIMAHFSSLGRIVDEIALIDGYAGGSSASISGFIYESILANPAVWNCPTGKCTPLKTRQRVSFLLKSTWELMTFLTQTDEALQLMQLKKDQAAANASGLSLEELIKSGQLNTDKLLPAFKLAHSKPLRDLTNPEFLYLLDANGTDGKPKSKELAKYHLEQAAVALKKFGKFELKTADGFLRPGIINFKELANKVGYIGDLYAGNINSPAKMNSILNTCAGLHSGKRWFDFAKSATTAQCATDIRNLISEELNAPKQLAQRRIDQPIGQIIPMLISTSYINGNDGIRAKQFVGQFFNNALPEKTQLNLFDNLKFAYWGQSGDLAQMNNVTRSDLKSKKRLPLQAIPWRLALSLSPAEPGLSRILEVPTNTNEFTAGGWSDLAPTLVLKDIGCKNTIYITRQGAESVFAREDVATTLGMTATQDKALYDLTDKNSSFSQSIESASLVYCTNWNEAGSDPTNFDKIDLDAATAKIYVPEVQSPNPHGYILQSSAPKGCRSGI